MKALKRTAFIIFLMFLLVFFLGILVSPPGRKAWGCCGIEYYVGGTVTNVSESLDTASAASQSGSNYDGSSGGDPVHLNSGNFSREKRLFFYPSRGMPTVISAFYNTQEIVAGPMGMGWSHSFDVSLVRFSDGTRVILWGDGRRERYVPKEGGGFTPPPGNFDTLMEDHNGYTLRTKYGTEYHFLSRNPTKAILSTIKDRNRNTITLNYDQNEILTTLTDTAGRSFTFNYSDGRITSIEDSAGRSVTFSYNQEGLLSSISDPIGNTVRYGYNDRKKLSSITDPKGQKYLEQTFDACDFPRVVSQNYGGQNFSLAYDFQQCMAKETKNGKTTTYFYAPDTGFQTQKTDPLGHSTRATYDEAGNLVQSFNPRHDYPTCFSYDDKSNCTRIEQPMNTVTTFTYEPDFSQMTSATDPNGNTSSFTYDSNGNRLTAANPLGETSSFSYDDSGQLIQVTNANGHSTSFTYDKAGNLITLTDSLQNTWHFGYDERGNRISVQDPLNHTTYMTYNLNDQVRAIKDPMGHITSFSYDENGKLSSVTDANGNTTSYEYEILDKISRVTDSMNHSISYSYNQDGLLSSITNARGKTTSFTYDAVERLVQTEDPLGRTTSLSYDEVGNVTSKTDGNGSTTVYSYDDIDRLTGKIFGDQSAVEYQYDPGSRRTLMKDRDGNASIYSYDEANRMTAALTRGNNEVAWQYDHVGNPTAVIHTNSLETTNYAYDADNRLSQVTHGGKVWSYRYDAAGRLMNRLYPNGIATNYEYNEANWLTLMAHTSGQHPLMSFQYTHDNVGNRTSKTITDGEEQHVWGYSYDALSRLTREVYPDTHDVVYTYDSNGNRLSRAGNGETVNYSYDAADQLLTSGAINCRWDGNGNLTRKADGNGTTNYQYDNENLLTKITLPDGTTESYVYNGNGLRVQKSRSRITTDYLLSGSDVLKEDTLGQGSRLSTYYVLGGSMAGPLALKQLSEQAPVYHYPLTDAQGSVMMLTDEGGNITDGYGYDAFGMGMTPPNPPPNQTYNTYRYTGQQSDSTSGLIYLRARYYDPQVGRFITSDPIGFGGGMNSYAYCGNNPVVYFDLTGLDVVFEGPQSEVRQIAQMVHLAISSSDLARQHYQQMVNSSTQYHIELSSTHGAGMYDPDTHTIYINPNTLILSPEEVLVMYAGTLAHELGHAYLHDLSPQARNSIEIEASNFRAAFTVFLNNGIMPADITDPGNRLLYESWLAGDEQTFMFIIRNRYPELPEHCELGQDAAQGKK